MHIKSNAFDIDSKICAASLKEQQQGGKNHVKNIVCRIAAIRKVLELGDHPEAQATAVRDALLDALRARRDQIARLEEMLEETTTPTSPSILKKVVAGSRSFADEAAAAL